MLIYINSAHEIPKGSLIELPATMVLFMEKLDAVIDRKLEKKPNSYTYRCIIDEPIHDPLVIKQNESIYQPNDIGLYPDYETGGLNYDDFMKKITNISHSKDIFLTEAILEQIKAIGFSGVWVFDSLKRYIITVKDIKSLVIGEVK